jgi:hypothetical protein
MDPSEVATIHCRSLLTGLETWLFVTRLIFCKTDAQFVYLFLRVFVILPSLIVFMF